MKIPVVLAIAAVLAACGRERPWTRLEVDELRSDPLLRLPDEMIYTIASAPDGAVFVSTFDGNVYRRMPRGREWTRVAAAPRSFGQAAVLAIYPFSARGFVATEFSRIYRWREGQPLREEKTVLSDSTRACGDFTSYVTLSNAWGTEDDTYVVGGHGNVLHYRGGRWRLERTPLTHMQPDLCYESYESDLVAAGGADGWVYAAGRRIIRSRGDGRWEEVPGPGRGDTTAAVGAIASDGGEMLFATTSGGANTGRSRRGSARRASIAPARGRVRGRRPPACPRTTPAWTRGRSVPAGLPCSLATAGASSWWTAAACAPGSRDRGGSAAPHPWAATCWWPSTTASRASLLACRGKATPQPSARPRHPIASRWSVHPSAPDSVR